MSNFSFCHNVLKNKSTADALTLSQIQEISAEDFGNNYAMIVVYQTTFENIVAKE